MSRKDAPDKETTAATDAVFQEGLPALSEPTVPEIGAEVRMPQAPAEGGQTADAGDARPSVTRVGDYLRELQQEFEGEQEEGKL